MTYLMAIDDTDMPDTPGTGWLVQELTEIFTRNGWAACSTISRHQLYVHEDVPYTSHNSAMCFELSLLGCDEQKLVDYTCSFLEERHVRGSDPGFCLAVKEDANAGQLLMAFGSRAKSEVIPISDAYDTAEAAGVHLSEHGGTGQGVIGALAAIGLRLNGNDGRYRGWYHFGRPGDIVTVSDLCGHDFVDVVATPDGEVLSVQEPVSIGSEKTKTVRIGHRQVILAVTQGCNGTPHQTRYRTITQVEAKSY
ncbi:MAG: hypothetical protein D3926_14360 [Desulfobacteraceae bacterium]|nr:MAG: hypothetical protein D3926_14360 [Desulfobacteraceae bacterium]